MPTAENSRSNGRRSCCPHTTVEEEALIEERLSGPKQRRRISAADLELMKKLQAEAAAADAAADARAASRNEGGY